MMRIGQPLKWPGGKGGGSQARDLLACRPTSFAEYREPFCGGAPFLWQPDLLPSSTPRWINDLDRPLINFYKQLKSDSTFIDRFLKLRDRILGHADRTIEAFETAKRDFTTNGVSYLLLRRLAVRQIVKVSRPNTASISFDYLVPVARPAIDCVRRPKLQESWSFSVLCADRGRLFVILSVVKTTRTNEKGGSVMRPKYNNQPQFHFQAAPTLKITESYYGRYDRIDAILAGQPELVDLIHRDIAEPLDCEKAPDVLPVRL